jgi:hypothetical protein
MVCGLQIAVNDSFLVRGFESVGNLPGDRESIIERDRTGPDAILKRRSLDELEHQSLRALQLLEPVNGGDVRMIQRGKRPCFAFEAGNTIRTRREGGRQNLDGDVTPETRITCPVDLAHPAAAKLASDLVGPSRVPDISVIAGILCDHTDPTPSL